MVFGFGGGNPVQRGDDGGGDGLEGDLPAFLLSLMSSFPFVLSKDISLSVSALFKKWKE